MEAGRGRRDRGKRRQESTEDRGDTKRERGEGEITVTCSSATCCSAVTGRVERELRAHTH